MKIVDIDKVTYRKRSNLVIISFVACLAILALVFGAILIQLFGSGPVNSSESTGNFHLNLMGVILSAVVSASIMNHFKTHPFLTEIFYVWQLKQIHNKIYRKVRKIKPAAEEQNVTALIILNFYYTTQKQVFWLDNNTLTMSTVQKQLDEIQDKIKMWNLDISLEDFDLRLLEQF